MFTFIKLSYLASIPRCMTCSTIMRVAYYVNSA